MNGLYIDQLVTLRGKKGDFRVIRHNYTISVQWTVDGLVVLDDTRPCRLKKQDGTVWDFVAGQRFKWDEIPGSWQIVTSDTESVILEGETIPVDSLEQWFLLKRHVSLPQSLAAIDRLISGQALEGTLTFEDLFRVRDYVEDAVSQGKIGVGEAYRWMMRWYDCFRMLSIRKMDGPVPDPRAVHWIQALFRP